MANVLTINIGAASKIRAEQQLRWLLERPEEVLILTETSGGAGTALILDHFRSIGYEVIHSVDPSGDRGVALVSRIPLRRRLDAEFAGVTIPTRIAVAELDTTPSTIVVGMYVPSRDRSVKKVEKKQAFLASLLSSLAALPVTMRNSLVIGGDYNVISRRHLPQYPQFMPFELDFLDELEQLGLVDAHEHSAPGIQEHTWVGRTADGYRYDYFHVGAELTGRIKNLAHLHEVRGHEALTDHSAVTLGLQLDHFGHVQSIPLPEEPPTLF